LAMLDSGETLIARRLADEPLCMLPVSLAASLARDEDGTETGSLTLGLLNLVTNG